MKEIEVAEIYMAPQGEGPNLGRLSLFVRTQRCNLHCSWCDSAYTWRSLHPSHDEYAVWTPAQLAKAMHAAHSIGLAPHAVVLTGGEPLIWQRQLHEAMLEYRSRGDMRLVPPIEVETSGTIMPSVEMLLLCQFNISHKMKSAGNVGISRERLWREDVIREVIFAPGVALGNVCFKPVFHPNDYEEIEVYLNWLSEVGRRVGVSWERLRQRVYLMPEATDAVTLAIAQKSVITLAKNYGVRCTTRLQILAYGNERRR